jgi:hypothetical protein
MHTEPLVVSRAEAQQLLKIGQSSFYKLVKLGLIHPLPGILSNKRYSYKEVCAYANREQTAPQQQGN